MTQHSDIIGGSSAERRIHCTGSAALEQSMPTPETSDAALEGTALHQLMYAALDDPDNGLPEAGKDAHVQVVEGDTVHRIHFTAEEMEERFWPAYEAVLRLIDEYDIVEYDLEITHAHERTCGPDVFGTLDFVGWTKDGRVVITDFKFGQGVRVYAKENLQLAFYAVGAWEAGERMSHDIVFAIIQPWRGEEDCVDTWETNQLWLENYRLQERKAYLRIVNNDTGLKAGKWCKFCKASPICPEQQQSLDTFALEAPVGDVPASMDAMKLSRLLQLGEQAVAMHKKLVDFAVQLGEQGVEIPGYKVVESLGHRKFDDEKLAELTAAQLVGTEAHVTKLKSPAQLEKTCKKLKVDFRPLEALIVRPSRGGRLVPDTDKRPQIAPAHAAAVEIPGNIIPLRPKRENAK